MKTQDTLVLYHADCFDGFGAVWAARVALQDSAEYIPVFHHTQPPQNIENKVIYFLDFVYRKEIMEEIKKTASKIIIIDHHKTGEESHYLADDILFDINHSGAVLSWQYFHKHKTTPKLLNYVEDVDLWKFSLPSSKEINEYIGTFLFDFDIWDIVASVLETEEGFNQAVKIGEVIQRKTEITSSKIVARAEEIIFEGYPCLAVNSTTNASLIGNKLCKLKPPIALVWFREKNRIMCSLRSDGTVDVSELAKRYGGGGHPAASGFSIEVNNLLNFIKK